MIRLMKKNKINTFTLLAYIIVFFYDMELFLKSINNSWRYIKEMIEILPGVMIISGLISTWIPKEVIVSHFGEKSGVRGKFISVLIGSVSAGPIYAAFPFAQVLLKKGASINNIVIIISSWAVMKIPMLIVEVKFLGLTFALSRYLLTLPGIVFLGYLVNKFLKREELMCHLSGDLEVILKIENILPGLNCGVCGYKSCREYASAIYNKNVDKDLCKVGKESVTKKLKSL